MCVIKDLKWFEDLCYLITGGALWLTTYGLAIMVVLNLFGVFD